MTAITDAVQAALAAGQTTVQVLDEAARAIFHPDTLVTVTSPEVPEIPPEIAQVTAELGLSRRPGRDGYLRVSLIVKAGMSTEDILKARAIAVRKLNTWFCEDSGAPPYEIGSLLSYSVHDEEHLSPIGRMSKGAGTPAR